MLSNNKIARNAKNQKNKEINQLIKTDPEVTQMYQIKHSTVFTPVFRMDEKISRDMEYIAIPMYVCMYVCIYLSIYLSVFFKDP